MNEVVVRMVLVTAQAGPGPMQPRALDDYASDFSFNR